MPYQVRRWIKPLLLLALSCLLVISACQRPVENNSTVEASTTSDCKVINHRLGEACVPLEPKRIVALDVPAILDPLLALDIKPVGTVVDYFGDGQSWSGERYFPALLPELVEEIEIVGVEPTPSIEKILQLEPDLILMADQFASAYRQLSKIAPSVIIDVWRNQIPIKENFQNIADIVGKEDKAAAILAQYQERIETFREQLGDRLLSSEISVLGYHENQIYASSKSASYFQVFQDLGLPIKPTLLERERWGYISAETLNDYDADLMFFTELNNPSEPLNQQPLIQSLEAVKNDQAYIVDGSIWEFYGPIGMDLFLDDLSKYVLDDQQEPISYEG